MLFKKKRIPDLVEVVVRYKARSALDENLPERTLYYSIIQRAWQDAFYPPDKKLDNTERGKRLKRNWEALIKGGVIFLTGMSLDWYRSRKAICHYADIEESWLRKQAIEKQATSPAPTSPALALDLVPKGRLLRDLIPEKWGVK